MGLSRQIIDTSKDKKKNITDKVMIFHRRKTELRKFKDSRRREIFNSVTLNSKQKEKIDKLFLENYGEKVPYIWHQHYTAFTGIFDENYFPELIYIPEFENYMNLWPQYNMVVADKNVLPVFARAAGIDMPEIILSSSKGILRNSKGEVLSREDAIKFISNIGEAFIKPTVDSSSGQGCEVVNFSSGINKMTAEKIDNIFTRMGKDFVVQERLICHSSISKIYNGSVNTFRIITYRWKDNIYHCPIVMRIGSGGGVLDNAHAGGMFIAVDDDGFLHNTAFTEFNNKYEMHPDSGVVFDRYQICGVKKVLEASKRMHYSIPQIGVVNWDFTLDKDETPVLIEANTSGGSPWLCQISHGKGAFGEKTPEILRWMKTMKKTPACKRDKMAFGDLI